MVKTKWVVLAVSLVSSPLLGSSSALAQTADWSGFYLGAQAGSGWGNNNNTLSQPLPALEISADLEGFVGGVHAGWNMQMESMVFGLEADVEASFMDADSSFSGSTFQLDVDMLGSLRARAGFAVDNFLVFGTAGLAVASSTYVDSNGGLSGKYKNTPFGFTIGGGLEVGLSDSLSARLEYRYTDLGTEDIDSVVFDPSVILKANHDFHTVRAGVSWHF